MDGSNYSAKRFDESSLETLITGSFIPGFDHLAKELTGCVQCDSPLVDDEGNASEGEVFSLCQDCWEEDASSYDLDELAAFDAATAIGIVASEEG